MIQRIPLNLSGAPNISYTAWPVTQGIPFADGALARGAPVRVVDEQGHVLATQAQCLTTWKKDLEYVKWLLVDFQADLAAGPARRLFLEYGPEAIPPPATVRVVVDTQSSPDITIDTAVLRVVLRRPAREKRSRPACDFFASCRVVGDHGPCELLSGAPGPFLYMRDQCGDWYDSCTAAPPPRISVEEAGPLRACVCVQGFHAGRHGQKFCPYILRMHFFAGRSDIRVYHTFIFDQDPHFVELASVGMHFPLNLGDALRLAIGGENRTHGADQAGALALVQQSDRESRVSLDDRPVAVGGKSAGWASMAGSQGSMVAVIRDHWQEYPKGFALGPTGLDVQVWPEHGGETLKFTSPFEEPAIFFNSTRDEEQVKRLLAERPTAPLNLKSFGINTHQDFAWVEAMIEKHAPGRTMTYNDTGTDDGAGAAKTTEIWLRFSTERIDDASAGAFCDCVQAPLMAPAEPAHTCATHAAGHGYPAGDPRFAEVDAGLDDILRLVAIEPVEKCRLYGMLRYGNMVCSHASGPAFAYLHYKDTEPEKALRFVGPYNNEANDQVSAVWGHFIHSGRREHYFLAQRYSRNVADVAFIHAHPSNPAVVGLMHYHNAHQWSGGGSPSHSLVRGLLTDYFFTGNRRLLDVARENADWIVQYQEPAGIVSCRHGALHREFTGPLWNLLEVYQATWEEKYGAVARRSLNWFLRTLPEPGNYPVSVYTRGERGDVALVEPPGGCTGHARDVYCLFEIALRLFDSAPLRRHILAEANAYAWNELTDNFVTADMARKMLTERSLLWPVDPEFYWTNWTTSAFFASPAMVCLAYDLTGDMVYAVVAREMLAGSFVRQADRVRRFCDFRFTWICFGGFVPCLMQIAADAMRRDARALAEAEKEWLGRRRQSGLPVYQGPGVDLDKDIMDANGNIINRPPADLPRQAPGRPDGSVTDLGRLSTEPL